MAIQDMTLLLFDGRLINLDDVRYVEPSTDTTDGPRIRVNLRSGGWIICAGTVAQFFQAVEAAAR